MDPELDPDRGEYRPYPRRTRSSRAPWDPPLRPMTRNEQRRGPDRPYDDEDMRRGTD